MSIGQFLERPRLLNRISSTKRKLKQQSSEMSPSNAQPQPPSYGMIDNDLITQANDLTSERVEFLSPPSGDIHVRGTSQPSEVHEDQFNSLGYAVNWDFVAVSSDFQHDLLFFNSRFAWYQYRYAKLIRETSHPEYSRALELQQRG